jgi:hypothetical protein
VEIPPDERLSLHGHDPADLIAAADEASEYVTRLLAGLHAPWTRRALCIGEPIEWFFPGKGQRNDAAMELCGRCEVRLECLAEALDDETLDWGIRGGATASARKVMRSNRTDGRSSIPDPDRCPPRCKCDDCKAHRAATVRAWRRRTGRTGPR